MELGNRFICEIGVVQVFVQSDRVWVANNFVSQVFTVEPTSVRSNGRFRPTDIDFITIARFLGFRLVYRSRNVGSHKMAVGICGRTFTLVVRYNGFINVSTRFHSRILIGHCLIIGTIGECFDKVIITIDIHAESIGQSAASECLRGVCPL